MSNKNKNHDDTAITLSDLVHIFKSHLVAICFGALFFSLLAAGFSLSRPVLYNIEGTFKDKGKTNAGIHGLSALLGGSNSAAEGEAMATIKSRKFMEKLIYRRGLQGVLIKIEPRFDLFGTMPQNLLVEYAHFMNIKYPILPDSPPAIWMHEVAYNDEVFKGLLLRFKDEDSFDVIEGNGVLVGQGELGLKFVGHDYAFTILKKTDESIANTHWALQLQPLQFVADNLLNLTTIESDRFDKNLLHIKLLNSNRHIGTEILNSMMLIYQEHIRHEQKRISKEQIAYLEQRQKEMRYRLKNMMTEHAQHMSKDMASSSFFNASRAIEYFAAGQITYQQRLYDIELAIKKLSNAKEEGQALFEGSGDGGPINHTLTEIRQLKQQSDILSLALDNMKKDKSKDVEVSHNEFAGIDLQTSKELYMGYNKHLNELQANIKQLQFLIEQLKNPDFEITSMSSLPNDFITNDIVVKASQIVQQIKDQNNRSSNEINRMKEQLTVQKEFLAQHLNQAIAIQKLKEQLTESKIIALQEVTLNLLRAQIDVLDKNMNEYISKRLIDLTQESELIASHQELLRSDMKDLPTKWVEEKLIDQQLAINQKLVQDITTLVESKNMESNLEILQSHPQDFAVPPLHPKSTRSILYAFFGAFAGAFITFTYFIVRSSLYGIKASVDNLKANHLHVSGFLSKRPGKDNALLDADLDTLRRISSYMSSSEYHLNGMGESLIMLNGSGQDFSGHLASLLAKRGLKVLLMPISFKNSGQSLNVGLIQYLEGIINFPEIAHLENYDVIYEGGFSRYITELIASPRFKELMVKLKTSYDWIIVESDVMPTSGQGEALVKLFDHTVANLTHENISDLKGYMQYKAENPDRKVTFVFS